MRLRKGDAAWATATPPACRCFCAHNPALRCPGLQEQGRAAAAAHERDEGGRHHQPPHRGCVQQVGLEGGQAGKQGRRVGRAEPASMLVRLLICPGGALSCSAAWARRYAEECQTPLGGWGLDAVLRSQAWKLRGELPLLLRPGSC